jgi:hypothetical protein
MLLLLQFVEFLSMGLWPISRNLHPAIVVLPCSIASVYAGAENRAEIHLQPFQTLCQRQI